MKKNIFLLVKIVLLSKYWSDAAKPCGWIHSIWGGGRREELPQATVTYKTMMSKIGMYCTFSWDAGTKTRSFEQSPLNLLNSLSLLQGYWLGLLQQQMKAAGEKQLLRQLCWHYWLCKRGGRGGRAVQDLSAFCLLSFLTPHFKNT